MDLLDENFENKAKNYAKYVEVKGVRHILHTERQPPKTCLNPIFCKNIEILGNLNLTFDVCIRAEELPDLYKLAKLFPKTNFIINHMGNLDIEKWSDKVYRNLWKINIKKLSSLSNMFCKISGLSSSVEEKILPAINYCFDTFGSERVMYASNFPVCNLYDGMNSWTKTLINITLPRGNKFQQSFFYDNANRIYNLEAQND
jgi:L-fuconolactonase